MRLCHGPRALSPPSAAATTAASAPKRLNVFERSLSLWVGLCMVVGVVLGLTAPGMMQGLRTLEFGAGSQINVPIAILIWLMITPMMMKVDFGSIRSVGRRPRGLFVTLFVNWLVKPFSMAATPDSELIAHLFDGRNEAVTRTIAQVIGAAHAAGRKIGICGQAPSDYPEFARFLVKAGIDSLSLSPDSQLKTMLDVMTLEQTLTSGEARRHAPSPEEDVPAMRSRP